jgi:DNA repair exonuclease SbcCD ATPase subunit
MIYLIIGFIVLAATGIVGFLFYLLNKEGIRAEKQAVPLNDLNEFKKVNDMAMAEEIYTPPPEAVKPLESWEVPDVPSESTPIDPVSAGSAAESILASPSEDYQTKVDELENELRQISEKAAGQAQEALSMIDHLNKEASILRLEKESQAAEFEIRLTQAQDYTTQLKTDNTALQSQLDDTQTKVRFLEEEFVMVKKQMGQELAQANTVIEELRKKEAQFLAPTPVVEDSQFEALQQENQTLAQANHDFQKSLQKLRELNDHLIEKSETLQYELTKARAQASGYERICENYKNQIEGLMKNPGSRLNRLPLNAAS